MSAPDLSLCPHCGGMTTLVPDPRFRWVCGACGGPRVPGASGKNAALVKARVAQAAAFGWSAGSIALAVWGALTAGLATLLWSAASHGLGAAIGVMAAAFLLFAWRASARAGAKRKEVAGAVKDGWREATRTILAGHGRDTTAAALAAEMRIDEAEADELLSELAAHEEVRVEIEDGSVKFRVPAAPPRVAAPTEDLDDAQASEHDDPKKERRA